MSIKEEKIIKAIKYELLGMCLDKELEVNINFSKQVICEKLYKKYNFTETEINQALNYYQKNSTDHYLYPLEFAYTNYIEHHNIIPLNEIIPFLEYFIKDLNIENPRKHFYIGYSLLSDLLNTSSEESFEEYRQKILSLLTESEIKKCEALYVEYNKLTVEIIKSRLKDIPEENRKNTVKYIEELFLT